MSETSLIPFNYVITEKLQSSKFPVFLISCLETGKTYVLKSFPLEDGVPKKAFLNESRFSFLNHPSIISFKHIQKFHKTIYKRERFNASNTIMEYAAEGDLTTFLQEYGSLNDEKLARTFFHQFIDGVEYLHSQGVVHMDLKLDNLLLGKLLTLMQLT